MHVAHDEEERKKLSSNARERVKGHNSFNPFETRSNIVLMGGRMCHEFVEPHVTQNTNRARWRTLASPDCQCPLHLEAIVLKIEMKYKEFTGQDRKVGGDKLKCKKKCARATSHK